MVKKNKYVIYKLVSVIQLKQKDGLVERINKTYVIEDGRQLIID